MKLLTLRVTEPTNGSVIENVNYCNQTKPISQYILLSTCPFQIIVVVLAITRCKASLELTCFLINEALYELTV